MPALEINLYQYTVVNGRITQVLGLQTLSIEDTDRDGLISQREIANYFSIKGQGHLLGSAGTDSAREATFTVGNTGNLSDYSLFTTATYTVGQVVDTSNLVQNFRPFDPAYSGVPCFSADALIATVNGPVPAGMLKVGDLVLTRDAGAQPIRWIGSVTITAERLALTPGLRPIRIKAGALGKNTPESDLVVSPQHRMLVRSRIAQKMFGADEVLVAAKQLCRIDGIEVDEDSTEITYVHFLFDDHQIVFANGAEAESLLVGAEALKGVGAAARNEILQLFPELAERPALPSRVLASGRMGRKLAVRHVQNAKPLLS